MMRPAYPHASPLKDIHVSFQFGEVLRGEKMLYSGTDPESYITDYTFVYEDKQRATDRPGPSPKP